MPRVITASPQRPAPRRARLLEWLCRSALARGVCGAALLSLMAGLSAGQVIKPKPAGPAAGNAPAAPGKPATGKAAPAKPGPTTSKPAPIPATADGEDYSGPTLPRDFVPPRKIPAIMVDVTELMSDSDETKIGNELLKEKFSTLRLAGEGETNPQVRATLQKGARFEVYRLTLRKYYLPLQKEKDKEKSEKDKDKEKKEKTIVELRDKLVRDTNQAGELMAKKNNNPEAARRFREFYMREIVARAAELLELNFHVRLNAVILLGELSVQGDEPFAEAADPLVKVIENPEQPEAVKIHAVKGLARICAFGKMKEEQKLKIGKALAKELKRNGTHFWYQMRLAEALGTVDGGAALDQERKPYVAQALSETLVDPARHWVVRSEAARSLGRIPLEGDVNVPLIAFETARLAQQMAEEYNKDPKGVFWKDCFLKTYLAFRPLNGAGKERGDGLMTKVEKGPAARHRAFVAEAYELILPAVGHVLDQKADPAPLPATKVDPMSEWLKKKQPQDYRVAPNLPALARLDQPGNR